MNDLVSKFSNLGYDLFDLDNVIYHSAGPGGTGTSDNCDDHCKKCALTCATCGSGCSNGPTK